MSYYNTIRKAALRMLANIFIAVILNAFEGMFCKAEQEEFAQKQSCL